MNIMAWTIIQASQLLWWPCEWANGKSFLHSQHNMVANSLRWWFQSLEKAQTSLYVWIHNIIWIYIKLIHIMWIHALGVHIYHMNLCIWIPFKQIPIFLTDVSCWSSVLCCLSVKIFLMDKHQEFHQTSFCFPLALKVSLLLMCI